MKNQSATAIFALIVAIVALIIGWTAYNRTGEDLGQVIESEVQQGFDDFSEEFDEFDDENTIELEVQNS